MSVAVDMCFYIFDAITSGGGGGGLGPGFGKAGNGFSSSGTFNGTVGTIPVATVGG